MFHIELVNHWFYNLINNNVNDELLLLVLPSFNDSKNKLKDSLEKLTKNYELVEISSIKSINELEKNKNIILLGYPMMNIYLLNNMEHSVLYISLIYLNQYFLSDKHIEDIEKSSMKKFVYERDRYLYFYEQREPIALLNTLSRKEISNSVIAPLLYSQKEIPFYFIQTIFPYPFISKDKDKHYGIDWETIINIDIFYLLKSHILTARLAILIYKVTTLKLDDSTTRIGIYYRQKLGVKSKTTRLPQNIYEIPGHTAKAYDLTNYFNSVKS